MKVESILFVTDTYPGTLHVVIFVLCMIEIALSKLSREIFRHAFL